MKIEIIEVEEDKDISKKELCLKRNDSLKIIREIKEKLEILDLMDNNKDK